jgi:hypothetical protein
MAEIEDLDVVDALNTARFPEGMTGSQINNAARALEGILARWYSDWDGSVTSTGSSNAYAITSNRTIGALTDGIVMAFTPNFTNTDAATLALNGLTAKSIKHANNQPVTVGLIVSGLPIVVVYKGGSIDSWIIISGAGVVPVATDNFPGLIEIATQAEMEAASNVSLAVGAGRQHFHPGMPKAWGRADSDGTLVSGDYNVATVVKDSTGTYTVTLTNALADTNYAVLVSAMTDNRAAAAVVSSSSVFVVTTRGMGTGALADSAFAFTVLGDMA